MLDNDHVLKLIERLRSRESHALDDFLANVAPALHRYGLRMCQNSEDAQDIAQESLIAVMKGIDGFRGQASVSTWLYTIARSFCIKKRRQSKFAPRRMESLHDVGANLAHTGSSVDRALQKSQFEEALNRVLDGMEEAQKEVFLLRDMEELSAKEVAETLGISESAVKSRLHRAREKVRNGMKSWFENSVAAELPATEMAVKKPLKCPHSKDISKMFSRFLEGDLDPALCIELKAHVANCPECKPKCDCLQTTLRFCSEAAKSSEMTPDAFHKLRTALEECETRFK